MSDDRRLVAINALVQYCEQQITANISMQNEYNLDMLQLSNLHKVEMFMHAFEIGNNLDIFENIKADETLEPEVKKQELTGKVNSEQEDCVTTPLKYEDKITNKISEELNDINTKIKDTDAYKGYKKAYKVSGKKVEDFKEKYNEFFDEMFEKSLDKGLDIENCFNCRKPTSGEVKLPAFEIAWELKQFLKNLKSLLKEIRASLDPTKITADLCKFIEVVKGTNALCISSYPLVAAAFPIIINRARAQLMELGFSWTGLVGPIISPILNGLTYVIETCKNMVNPIFECILNAFRTMRISAEALEKVGTGLVDQGKLVGKTFKNLTSVPNAQVIGNQVNIAEITKSRIRDIETKMQEGSFEKETSYLSPFNPPNLEKLKPEFVGPPKSLASKKEEEPETIKPVPKAINELPAVKKTNPTSPITVEIEPSQKVEVPKAKVAQTNKNLTGSQSKSKPKVSDSVPLKSYQSKKERTGEDTSSKLEEVISPTENVKVKFKPIPIYPADISNDTNMENDTLIKISLYGKSGEIVDDEIIEGFEEAKQFTLNKGEKYIALLEATVYENNLIEFTAKNDFSIIEIPMEFNRILFMQKEINDNTVRRNKEGKLYNQKWRDTIGKNYFETLSDIKKDYFKDEKKLKLLESNLDKESLPYVRRSVNLEIGKLLHTSEIALGGRIQSLPAKVDGKNINVPGAKIGGYLASSADPAATRFNAISSFLRNIEGGVLKAKLIVDEFFNKLIYTFKSFSRLIIEPLFTSAQLITEIKVALNMVRLIGLVIDLISKGVDICDSFDDKNTQKLINDLVTDTFNDVEVEFDNDSSENTVAVVKSKSSDYQSRLVPNDCGEVLVKVNDKQANLDLLYDKIVNELG